MYVNVGSRFPEGCIPYYPHVRRVISQTPNMLATRLKNCQKENRVKRRHASISQFWNFPGRSMDSDVSQKAVKNQAALGTH